MEMNPSSTVETHSDDALWFEHLPSPPQSEIIWPGVRDSFAAANTLVAAPPQNLSTALISQPQPLRGQKGALNRADSARERELAKSCDSAEKNSYANIEALRARFPRLLTACDAAASSVMRPITALDRRAALCLSSSEVRKTGLATDVLMCGAFTIGRRGARAAQLRGSEPVGYQVAQPASLILALCGGQAAFLLPALAIASWSLATGKQYFRRSEEGVRENVIQIALCELHKKVAYLSASCAKDSGYNGCELQEALEYAGQVAERVRQVVWNAPEERLRASIEIPYTVGQIKQKISTALSLLEPATKT